MRASPEELAGFATDTDRASYIDRLAVGSYPEAASLLPRLRARWFNDYLQGVLGRDLTDLRRSVEPARALALLRVLAGRQSGELVKSTVAERSALPASTVTGYLDLLHDVGLLTSVPPWPPNLSKREIGRPKTIVADSGLAMRLARISGDQLRHIAYGETF